MRSFISILAVLFLFSFCTPVKNQGTGKTLRGTKWYLTSIHTGGPEMMIPTHTVYLRIDPVKNNAGGNGGCNQFGSTVKVEGSTIQFSELFSTKMFCDGIQQSESAYFNALENATKFEIKGDKLVIYQNNKSVLFFEAGDDF